MRIILAITLLVGCDSRPVAAAPQEMDPFRVTFVSQCAYDNGARVLLAHRFASDSYTVILNHHGRNDLSTIRAGSRTPREIETNGGVGKIDATGRVFDWLMTQPFRAVSESRFTNEFERTGVARCPGEYEFSP